METKRIASTMWVMVCCVLLNCALGDFRDNQGVLKELVFGYDGQGTDGVGFHVTNDAAGYSDWIWYGPTDIHDYGYHEVLSGEWGAAIYYNGIDTNLTTDPNDSPTRRQAM